MLKLMLLVACGHGRVLQLDPKLASPATLFEGEVTTTVTILGDSAWPDGVHASSVPYITCEVFKGVLFARQTVGMELASPLPEQVFCLSLSGDERVAVGLALKDPT